MNQSTPEAFTRLSRAARDLRVFADATSANEVLEAVGTVRAEIEALRGSLNGMLRCYDYGKSTRPAEWEREAAQARLILSKPTP